MAIPAERVPGLQVHAHHATEICDWCEQPIPPDRLKEVRGRIAARELERANEITTRLRDQFAQEKAEEGARAQAQLEAARAESRADVERVRAESAARERLLQAEATRAADANAQQRIAEAEATHRTAESLLQTRLEDMQRQRAASEEAHAATSEELARVRADSAAALEASARAFHVREQTIREDMQRDAQATTAQQLTALTQERDARESELRQRVGELDTQRQRTEEANRTLHADLLRAREEVAAAAEASHRHAQEQAEVARAEATQAAAAQVSEAQQRASAAEQRAQQLLANAEADRARAVASVSAELKSVKTQLNEAEIAQREARDQLQALKSSHEVELQQRLHEQREILGRDKDQAVRESEARAFGENQKLQVKVQDLTRQLERMSAAERGEGGEIQLYDALKSAFEGDRIKRVPHGVAGADIIHEVMRNGKVCGKIIYDSKNRSDYKSSYAKKLRQDQLAAKAEHAVLVSNHFPANTRQLHVEDHVIVACPARVVTIAEILRRQILQLHELRVSNDAREAKTEALYAYITSEAGRQRLDLIEKLVDELSAVDVAEEKAHRAVWIKRGKLLTAVLKAHGEFSNGIDRIIGTAD